MPTSKPKADSLAMRGPKKNHVACFSTYLINTDAVTQTSECGDVAGIPEVPNEGVLWIEVDGIHDHALIESIGKRFTIHPLILEDISNVLQRPKKDDLDGYSYIVVKMIQHGDKGGAPIFEQVSFILGKNLLITFQEGKKDVFEPVRKRLQNPSSRLRKLGADYLMYNLIDGIVDEYFTVLEDIGESIEELEHELVDKIAKSTLPKIYKLKRSILIIRRAAWPLRELLNSIGRGETAMIQKETLIYFRDIYDHVVEIIDVIENARETSASMIDMYLSSISNRLNEVMRVLTVITTIFMPLSFIAGLYGMNFKFMPELDSPYGYPAVLVVMILISIGMIAYFRKKGWL